MDETTKDNKEHKKAAGHDSDVPKPISSLDLETSARSKRFLQASIGPAVMGLVSAALLVGVIALYAWGSTISSDSSNTTNLAVGWEAVLPAAALLMAAVVGVGLPVWWSYKKGFGRVVMVLAAEGLALLIVLLVSALFLFNGPTNGNPPTPNPVGCGCSGGTALYCVQCD